jgi:hypothetical protein
MTTLSWVPEALTDTVNAIRREHGCAAAQCAAMCDLLQRQQETRGSGGRHRLERSVHRVPSVEVWVDEVISRFGARGQNSMCAWPERVLMVIQPLAAVHHRLRSGTRAGCKAERNATLQFLEA